MNNTCDSDDNEEDSTGSGEVGRCHGIVQQRRRRRRRRIHGLIRLKYDFTNTIKDTEQPIQTTRTSFSGLITIRLYLFAFFFVVVVVVLNHLKTRISEQERDVVAWRGTECALKKCCCAAGAFFRNVKISLGGLQQARVFHWTAPSRCDCTVVAGKAIYCSHFIARKLVG